MDKKTPSLEEWRQLYEAATLFKKSQCWDWMFDDDVFGVKNPETGKIGYCSVLGMYGEFYGLSVHLGTEGLNNLTKIQNNKDESKYSETIYIQKCLMASFENREELEQEDYELIQKLGFKFRGANAWPLFRRYDPGYFPRPLNREEVLFLTWALEQAVDVSQRILDEEIPKTPNDKGLYLVRVAEKKTKELVWHDEWLKPTPIEKTIDEQVIVDEFRLERMKKSMSKGRSVWEVDYFFFPAPIGEGDERPFFPYSCLWVEHSSGFVINSHIAIPVSYKQEFTDKLIDSIEIFKEIPQTIILKREEPFYLFQPIAQKLDIDLQMNDSLPMLEEARKSMIDFLDKGKEELEF